MKSAYLCRACHRRLQASQAAPASLRFNQTPRRRFTADQQQNGAASTQSSLGLGVRSHSNHLESNDKEDLPRQEGPGESSSQLDSDFGRLAAGSQIIRALSHDPSRVPGKHGKSRASSCGSAKENPMARVDSEALGNQQNTSRHVGSQNTKGAVLGTSKQKERRPKPSYESRIAKKRTERYLQWGYIRHMHPESELASIRSAFNRWKRGIALIQRRRTPSKASWFEDGQWLFAMKNVAEMQGAWETLDTIQRQQMWPRVMLSTLYMRPSAAFQVLSATLSPPPPGYAIQDVLLIIAKTLRAKSMENRKGREKGEQLLRLLTRVIEDFPPGYMPFGQRTFGLFARKLSGTQTMALYTMLKRSNAMFHPYTALHFARKLAGSAMHVEHKQAAFEILNDLSNNGLDLNKPQPASVITSLLHCKAPDEPLPKDSSGFSPANALQVFMERGFLPNAVTFTAFLDTLCQRREVDEAIRIAKLFANNGLQLDAKSYATIFRGAKHTLKVENIREVLEFSTRTSAPQVDVLNNALHAIFCFSEMEVRENKRSPSPELRPFLPMLRLYAKKFDLEPLQSLIPDSLPLLLMQEPPVDHSDPDSRPKMWHFERTILPVVDGFVSSSDSERLQPDSTTLATMLRAYIKSLWRPYDLMSLYSYFKSHLEGRGKKSNHAVQLVRNESSLIHDTFILAMMQQPGLTRPALEIFGDMLKDNLNSSRAAESGGIPAPVHPAPTIFTFGILLNGLMRRRETNLAEQVNQVMKENGIKPDIVAWNIQIKGYALMQNVPRTVGALQDLEASGFKPDHYTFKAFGRLRKQKQALEMMEKIIDLNKRRMNEQQPSA